ncbi:MAG: Ppx/GppA phosphatase family protein [Parvularculaceae bacterium]
MAETAARQRDAHRRRRPYWRQRYAALDLGTNNCRLLVSSVGRSHLRIVDAFSRIVRLGEGVSQDGRLSEAAIDRTLEALKACREKIDRRNVDVVRCIATQACRSAENAEEFLARAKCEAGLDLEIISTEEEARLSVLGCAQLIDPDADGCLIFDIGGGSTELSWVDLRDRADRARPRRFPPRMPKITAWTSLPFGVVSLSEKHGLRDYSRAEYDDLVTRVAEELRNFQEADELREIFQQGRAHLLGTSGTVTSIAGVHLGLPRYERSKVDGLWLSADEARRTSERLRSMTCDQRSEEPCIGRERADLVVSGCAILEAILQAWPADRLRVADRGLREGMIYSMIHRARRRRRRRPPAPPS